MPRKKLKRFAQLGSFPNLHLPGEAHDPHWFRHHFPREAPLTLELACGWGEYAIALARRSPQRNFVGVDAKGERLWKAAKTALELGLTNVVFLKTDIEYLAERFPPRSVEEIWLTFPDPHPKRKKAKHRLTSPRFLPIYKALLQPGGKVHLKTDDEGLFRYTQETVPREGGRVLVAHADLYALAEIDELLRVQTKYERRHLAEGRTIKYLCFVLEPEG